jgi:hypothetical protein
MEQFSIGRTLTRSFQLIGNGIGNVGVFLLIAYLANTAVSFVTQQFLVDDMARTADSTDPMAALSIFKSFWYWFTILFSLALSAFVSAGSIHGFLNLSRGKSASIGECCAVGFAQLLPMLGLTLLWSLAVGLGFVLLIVPGVILITIWAAAMPALSGEGLGVFASFGRSRDLTRGSRWSVFAVLLIVVVVIYALVILLLGGLIGGSMMSGAFNLDQLENVNDPVVLIGSTLAGWAMAMLINSVITSIYVELVLVKEGARTDDLTDVFQ